MSEGMMTGMDLVEFLRARLDEDEQVARAAIGPTGRIKLGPGRWEAGSGTAGHVEADDFDIYDEGTFNSATAEHVARHDPARVLVEVEFKRHVIDTAVSAANDYYDSWLIPRFLTRMARAYADHPDYRREEWNCGRHHDTAGRICVEPVGHDFDSPGPATPHRSADGSRWVHHRDFIGPGEGFREWDEDVAGADLGGIDD